MPPTSGEKTFARAFDKAKKRKRIPSGLDAIDTGDLTARPRKKKTRPPKKKKDSTSSNASDNLKKKVLSSQALDLSFQLKECSKKKNLEEALSLFWDKRSDGIVRDQHLTRFLGK